MECWKGMLISKIFCEISLVARMVKLILNGDMPGVKMEELDQEGFGLRMQFMLKAKEKSGRKNANPS